jgi:hypothetical protein
MRDPMKNTGGSLYRVALVAPGGKFYEASDGYTCITEDREYAKREFDDPTPGTNFDGSPRWPGPVARVCGLMWNHKTSTWDQAKFRDARPGEFC